ncbi:MAG: SDR family NAD(P)-dependent oxidoreductase, partial [Bacteroidota bacterium]
MNIIITGAGKGIGFETVKAFSKDPNNNIITISRNIDQLKNLEILGENTFLFPISYDLSDINFDLKERIGSHFNKIDILINNAGLLINKPFDDLTDNDFDQMFNINVKSVFKLINLLLPFFQPESHIVNISSMG